MTTPTAAPSTIRRAIPDDTTDIAEMVSETAAHENQSAHVHVDEVQWRRLLARPEVIVLIAHPAGGPVDNVDAQRFYRRLGATLGLKVLAAWPHSAYADLPGTLS